MHGLSNLNGGGGVNSWVAGSIIMTVYKRLWSEMFLWDQM
jgi:hypothetical protein